MLRFTCNQCGQKMKVPPEYAGKKVRCKGCQQTLRVPAARQEPVAAASGVGLSAAGRSASDDFLSSSSSSSGIDLAELAAMEAKAPVGVVQHDPNAYPQGKQPCPSCGAPCSEEAKLCVQCGFQFDAGKKLRTKKTSDKVASRVSGGASAGPTFTAEPKWGTVIAGLFCIVFGICVMVMDFNPGEDSRGTFAKVLSWLYAVGGAWVAGGLLIVAGLVTAYWGWQGHDDD